MEPQRDCTYYVEISAKASADFAALDSNALWATYRAVDSLKTDPRPPDVRRRTAPGHYSLRVGLDCILYAVDEEARLITIQRLRRRPPQHRQQRA